MDVVYFNSLLIGVSLLTVVLAVIALLAGLLYYGLRVSTRIYDLERSQGAFQAMIVRRLEVQMAQGPKSDNPGEETRTRRDILLAKLRTNEITRSEAMELNEILFREEEAAKKRGDVATLIAIGLGLAVVASVLAKSKK